MATPRRLLEGISARCPQCGSTQPASHKKCAECRADLHAPRITSAPERVAGSTFLWPLILGPIGGVIGMVQAWSIDRSKAWALLLVGFVSPTLWLVILLWLG